MLNLENKLPSTEWLILMGVLDGVKRYFVLITETRYLLTTADPRALVSACNTAVVVVGEEHPAHKELKTSFRIKKQSVT